MDDIIIISNLNDFIFCPASIYFHKLYGSQDNLTYQSSYQINGSKAHESVDNSSYSTKKSIYDMEKQLLIERKKHISKIYDGYVFQLYAQYYALTEMGYAVQKLEIRSLDDNKKYKINLPDEDLLMKN